MLPHLLANKDMLQRLEFFRSMNGAVGRSLTVGLDLAKAEWRGDALAVFGCLRVRWEYDTEPYQLGDGEDEYPEEVLGCVVEMKVPNRTPESDGWEHAESLWSIGDPSDRYRRLVAAELLSELFARNEKETSMADEKVDWEDNATEDAWEAVEEFMDQIIEQFESGSCNSRGQGWCDIEMSDYNDEFSHGRVDNLAGIDLRDAADILDQLSDHEETDAGLWEGIDDPVEAVICKAQYTYRAAIEAIFRDLMGSISSYWNEVKLDDWADDDNAEAYHKALAKLHLEIVVRAGKYSDRKDDEAGFLTQLWSQFMADADVTDCTAWGVYLDWLEDRPGSEGKYLRDLGERWRREYAALPKLKADAQHGVPVTDEDEDGEVMDHSELES